MPDDTKTGPARYELPLSADAVQAEQQAGGDKSTAVSNETLAANALWFCRLRWVIFLVLTAFGAFSLVEGAPERFGLRPGATWAFACASILAVFNIAFIIRLRCMGESPKPGAIHANLWMQIVVDLLVLTGVVHFVGSLETHAANAFLFHIVLSCIFFTRRQSAIVMLLACLLFLLCVQAELTGLIQASQLHLDTTIRKSIEASRGEILMGIGSIWGTLLAVWYLASNLSVALRQNEHDLSETNTRLIVAQQERTRHMMHTAHELKTPCASIYANVRVLIDGYCGDLPEEAVGVLNKVSNRCLGLAAQIQDMLRLANLRSDGETEAKVESLSISGPLQWCIEQVSATADQRQVTIETDIRPASTKCVEDHLKMFFLNLLSNAVNYSKEGGTVRVSGHTSRNHRPHVTISDEGIGIQPEKLPHIFEEYYRTNAAAQHNRASSGLGLAIVQQIAREHQIDLTVESELGKGTVFQAILPPDEPAADATAGGDTLDGEHTGS